MMRLTIVCLLALSSQRCWSFAPRTPSFETTSTRLRIDSATSRPPSSVSLRLAANSKTSSSESSSVVQLIQCEGDDSSMSKVAEFMVDAFWLGSPQGLVRSSSDSASASAVSDATRTSLLLDQQVDLMSKYGDQMGQRLLGSCMILAVNNDQEDDNILGVVCLDVCLLDEDAGNIINMDKAEALLKNAVASLGPKERRFYKDASLPELCADLLPNSQNPICCISNLAVSPKARRQGIAQKLVGEAERIARDDWEATDIYLKVEADNTAARGLYEGKFGYSLKYTVKDETALRVDDNAGGFVEIEASTLILRKSL